MRSACGVIRPVCLAYGLLPLTAYSTADTLLAGKTKSILKPCLARESVCLCLLMCACVRACVSCTPWDDVLNQQKTCWHLHKSTFCPSVKLQFTNLQHTFKENTPMGHWSHIDGSASRFRWAIPQSPGGSYRQSINCPATLTCLGRDEKCQETQAGLNSVSKAVQQKKDQGELPAEQHTEVHLKLNTLSSNILTVWEILNWLAAFSCLLINPSLSSSA